MDAKISNSDEMKNVLQVKDIPTGITLSILSNCHYYTFKIGLVSRHVSYRQSMHPKYLSCFN